MTVTTLWPYLGTSRLYRGRYCQPQWAGTRRYGVPADAISVPADSTAAVVKFTISIPRESCTNSKAKYSSSVVPPDPSVHFYHWSTLFTRGQQAVDALDIVNIIPTSCVSLPGKHFIPLSLPTSLNSFLTIFCPDPCVLPIRISLPDQQVLLATFPPGPFLCLHLLLGTLYLYTFVLRHSIHL